MAAEEQSQVPMRYMTVPEKIELGGGGGGGAGIAREQTGGGGRYRPMKVPDKITLEPTVAPPPAAVAGVVSGEGGEGEGGGVGGGMLQRAGGIRVGGAQSSFQPPEPTANLQTAPVMQMAEVGPSSAPLVELERRVRTLEHQVQRLTNTIVNNRPPTAPSSSQQGNGFWYVLTFTGWMMVPLVVVFLYHYKKSL